MKSFSAHIFRIFDEFKEDMHATTTYSTNQNPVTATQFGEEAGLAIVSRICYVSLISFFIIFWLFEACAQNSIFRYLIFVP